MLHVLVKNYLSHLSSFSLVSRLEETLPHFLPHPRVLLPEKSQKFPAFSILEVSIHILSNCSLWLSCATQVLGFCFSRFSAKTLFVSHLSSEMLFGLLTLPIAPIWWLNALSRACLPQVRLLLFPASEKAPCTPCNPRREHLWPPRGNVGTLRC